MWRLFTALLAMTVSASAFAGAIVAGKNSKLTAISSRQLIQQMFLGRISSVEGVSVTVVTQRSSRSSEEFAAKVMEERQGDFDTARMRLIFTGVSRPPLTVYDDSAVKAAVNGDASRIGYISDDSVDKTVTVLFRY